MPDETEDGPVLETLGAMTAASLERCDLAPDALLLVRIAALAAVDARRCHTWRTSARRLMQG
jgi:hypothetical protein